MQSFSQQVYISNRYVLIKLTDFGRLHLGNDKCKNKTLSSQLWGICGTHADKTSM